MAPGYFLLFIIHPLKLCIMTTTNRLCYTVSKRYIQAGTTFEINVKILLADDCKNNICDWSITADIYEQRKNGRFVWCAGGCCHEEILKRFPQFKMFVDLHLSNHYGVFGCSAKSSEANLKEKPTKRNILLNWILI